MVWASSLASGLAMDLRAKMRFVYCACNVTSSESYHMIHMHCVEHFAQQVYFEPCLLSSNACAESMDASMSAKPGEPLPCVLCLECCAAPAHLHAVSIKEIMGAPRMTLQTHRCAERTGSLLCRQRDGGGAGLGRHHKPPHKHLTQCSTCAHITSRAQPRLRRVVIIRCWALLVRLMCKITRCSRLSSVA